MEKYSETLVTGRIVEEEILLTLDEFCVACAARQERIVELVEEGVLEPAGRETERWQFGGASLRRARVALRLQRDLDVNLAGVALALELLDEIASLRARLRRIGGD